MPTIRNVDDCPYRIEPRGTDVTARCGLVERIVGVGDSPVTRIGLETCQACCREAQPSRQRLNPIVASLLFVITHELLQKEGEPEGDVRRAQELNGWAASNLAGADQLGLTASRPRDEGPCFHLGAAVGWRECTTPRGRARVESFACHHVLHDQTTRRECQLCPDFEPRLRQRDVVAWAVGVVTAPRAEPTLPRCLHSLVAAGWDDFRLFVEPGADVPLDFSDRPTTYREATLGEWPNWFLGLSELYQRDPEADAYMMVQDDTVFSRDVRRFLEADLWPAPRLGMVSVYCPEPYARPDPGWHSVEHLAGLMGALTCIFPNAAVRALLAHPEMIEHRRRGARQGLVDTDGAIGRWADREALPVYYHSPSLAQHIGDTSTVWPDAPNDGLRHSSNFAGEDFDARTLPPRQAVNGTPARERLIEANHTESNVEILNSPLVSCIMPTADRREFVRLSLELFRNQDYPRKELIIVDDGDDPVGDLAEGVPGVRYIRLETRATIGEKRNRACTAAWGEIIAHWDDDDWYAPNRLRYQAGPIVADEADVTGLVGSHVLMLPDTFWTIEPELHGRMFFGDVHGGTLVFHRSLWQQGMRYPDQNHAEDADLLRQALGSGKRLARLTNSNTFVYVRHQRNTWIFDPETMSDTEGWSPGAAPEGFPATMLRALQRAALAQSEVPGAAEGVVAPANAIARVEPVSESQILGPEESLLVDCLGRAAIHLPAVPVRAERCIATVVTPGFTNLLEDLLGSLRANGGCPDARVVVFAVNPDPECRGVARKYGATLIPCDQRSVVNITVKSVLYSAARVIEAERFLCLDADTLIVGDLGPVFASLDASPEGTILAAREGNGPIFANLETALVEVYGGRREDLAFLLGEESSAGSYPFVVNDGLFAAGRAALLALDETIRQWRNAPAWVDERDDVPWRNQFVFNLALAHLGCGVELAPSFNIQLQDEDVEWSIGQGRPQAHWRGRPARVLHFNGGGRLKYPEWRTAAAHWTDVRSIGNARAILNLPAVETGLSVAIVIPCHNYGHFLAEAIESALAQTQPAAEILVVDDASTDDTQRVAARYAGRGVRSIRVEHRDVHLTRRSGFEATTADVLFFLDADNIAPPDYLERGLPLFAERNVGIVYSARQCFGDSDDLYDPPDFDPGLLERLNYIDASALVTRQALLISGALNAPTGESWHADWRMWLRVAEAGFLARKQPARLRYRVHPAAMSQEGARAIPSYFDRAGLERAIVTIFTPLAGRRTAWGRYSAWLESQTWPRDHCRLVLCDTSQDSDYYAMVRRWAIESAYQDVRVYRQTVGPPGLADAPRGTSANTEEVNDACRRIYSRMAKEVETPFVLVVEDDVIPPADAIDRLLRLVAEDVAAVSALYRARSESGGDYVVWMTDPVKLDRLPMQPTPVGPIDVGGTGFGCLLLRRSWIAGETFARLPGDPVYYDVAFGTRLKAKGGRWVLDCSCVADHLETPANPAHPAPPAPRVLVLAHVFHDDLWAEIAESLHQLGRPFDLYVNAVLGHVAEGWENAVQDEFPGAKVLWSENRGLDVGGTISLLPHVDLTRYDLVCKVHTKKCVAYDTEFGTWWRRELLRSLFNDPAALFDIFNDPDVSMVTSRELIQNRMTVNRADCDALYRRLGLDPEQADGAFAAGTMFWCRPFVFQAIKDASLSQDEFATGYERDGTLAHAVERVFGSLARSRGQIVGR